MTWIQQKVCNKFYRLKLICTSNANKHPFICKGTKASEHEKVAMSGHSYIPYRSYNLVSEIELM